MKRQIRHQWLVLLLALLTASLAFGAEPNNHYIVLINGTGSMIRGVSYDTQGGTIVRELLPRKLVYALRKARIIALEKESLTQILSLDENKESLIPAFEDGDYVEILNFGWLAQPGATFSVKDYISNQWSACDKQSVLNKLNEIQSQNPSEGMDSELSYNSDYGFSTLAVPAAISTKHTRQPSGCKVPEGRVFVFMITDYDYNTSDRNSELASFQKQYNMSGAFEIMGQFNRYYQNPVTWYHQDKDDQYPEESSLVKTHLEERITRTNRSQKLKEVVSYLILVGYELIPNVIADFEKQLQWHKTSNPTQLVVHQTEKQLVMLEPFSFPLISSSLYCHKNKCQKFQLFSPDFTTTPKPSIIEIPSAAHSSFDLVWEPSEDPNWKIPDQLTVEIKIESEDPLHGKLVRVYSKTYPKLNIVKPEISRAEDGTALEGPLTVKVPSPSDADATSDFFQNEATSEERSTPATYRDGDATSPLATYEETQRTASAAKASQAEKTSAFDHLIRILGLICALLAFWYWRKYKKERERLQQAPAKKETTPVLQKDPKLEQQAQQINELNLKAEVLKKQYQQEIEKLKTETLSKEQLVEKQAQQIKDLNNTKALLEQQHLKQLDELKTETLSKEQLVEKQAQQIKDLNNTKALLEQQHQKEFQTLIEKDNQLKELRESPEKKKQQIDEIRDQHQWTETPSVNVGAVIEPLKVEDTLTGETEAAEDQSKTSEKIELTTDENELATDETERVGEVRKVETEQVEMVEKIMEEATEEPTDNVGETMEEKTQEKVPEEEPSEGKEVVETPEATTEIETSERIPEEEKTDQLLGETQKTPDATDVTDSTTETDLTEEFQEEDTAEVRDETEDLKEQETANVLDEAKEKEMTDEEVEDLKEQETTNVLDEAKEKDITDVLDVSKKEATASVQEEVEDLKEHELTNVLDEAKEEETAEDLKEEMVEDLKAEETANVLDEAKEAEMTEVLDETKDLKEQETAEKAPLQPRQKAEDTDHSGHFVVLTRSQSLSMQRLQEIEELNARYETLIGKQQQEIQELKAKYEALLQKNENVEGSKEYEALMKELHQAITELNLKYDTLKTEYRQKLKVLNLKYEALMSQRLPSKKVVRYRMRQVEVVPLFEALTSLIKKVFQLSFYHKQKD
ncbi:hypothetical protein WDW89_21435 [Deltaproteobacteria bacterium TL4]